MKGERWLSALEGALLSFCIAFSGCGCLVSGFGMKVPMTTVAWCCGLCALLLSVCAAFRLRVPALCALALAGGYLWQSGKGNRGIEALLRELTQIYNLAYNCGTIGWSGKTLTAGDLTVGICLAGGLVTLVLCLVVCRRRGAWFGLPVGLAPLAACLVVTDTVPDTVYLFWLLLGILLLLLTQTTRRKSAAQSLRLLGMLALPAALALGILFWAVPQEGYQGQDNAEKTANAVVSYAQDLALPEAEQPWQVLGLELDTGGLQGDKVNLSQIGPQTLGRSRVMNVTAAENGALYLRGCSFDTYDGTSWTNTGSYNQEQALWPAAGLETVGEVSITTRSAHPVLYFPYYPEEMDWQQFTDGRLNNNEHLTTYTFTQLRVPEGYSSVGSLDEINAPEPEANSGEGALHVYVISALEPYLALPDGTRAGAKEILAQIFPDGPDGLTVSETASAIAAYVRNSAAYDLKTERMPSDAEDFALWFLEESDTGYCVHFATASTVLLRAAGIPARYVTGYLVNGLEGKSVMVRGENAHAWVEYYVYGVGWTMLESTPSAGGDTQDIQPSQETPSVQPTVSQPDQPDAEIRPSQVTPGTNGTPTKPETQTPAEEESRPPDFSWLWRILKALARIGALAAVVLGQWRLRLYLRRRQQHRGDPNAQALARWQEVVLLSRLLADMPNPDLFELAQKAKYSQYTLTPEELGQFDVALDAAKNRLRQRPLARRLIDRLVFAAY